MVILPTLIVLVLVTGVAGLGLWRNETALMELHTDWQANSNPAEHQFVHEVHDKYRQNSSDPFANNLMGILHRGAGDPRTASKYFRIACDHSYFQIIAMVKNFALAQNLVDARETVSVLAAALQDDIYNGDLISELAHWLKMVCNASVQPLATAVSIIRKLPTIHPLWVVFVEQALQMGDLSAVGLDPAGVATITTYGLTIFPRSCELLLLRATLYLQEGNIICAGEIYLLAEQVKHLSTNAFNVTMYLEQLRVRTMSTQSMKNAAQCGAKLHSHETAHYQAMYSSIANLIGDSWTNVSTHNIMPVYRRPEPIMTTSITTVETRYADGTTTTTHLPSLQVGCSTPIYCARPGFMIADALEAISTHYVTMAYDLHMIESGSVGVVYSSHTLEHLSYNNPPATCASFPVSYRNGEDRGCYSELDAALAEWRRVLATGGTLLVSVPDMMVLARNFNGVGANTHGRAILRSIMYGGQQDQFDFHKNAFYFEYLQELLESHAFCNIVRVPEFGLFMDSSGGFFGGGESYSVNVKATAC